MPKEQNEKRYLITLVICIFLNIIALFFIDPEMRAMPIALIVIIIGLITVRLAKREKK